MPIYTIYLHTPGRATPSFRVCECADDAAALLQAEEELLFSRAAERAEVRADERVVTTLTRAAARERR